jgi:phosphodiesterase/alkaline phosphatase D-like protein
MTCSVLGLTPAQINALRAAPSLVSDLGLALNDHRWKALLNDVLEHAPADRRAELEARQAHFEQSPAGREAAEREGEAYRAIAGLGALESALVTSWRLLHFVSVGDVSAVGSLADLLLSGESVGGCGSARLHGEAQTRELSRFLDAQGREWLLCASGMPEWEFNDEKDLREEVDRHFPRLRDYVRAMADKGNGLVVLMG